MLVIFEGVDGSGKTTAIQKIREQTNYNTMKALRHDTNTFADYFDAATSDDITLCDRSPISDIVYRLCDTAEVGAFNLFDIAFLFDRGKVKIVYCDTEQSYVDAINRGEDFVTLKSHHDELRQLYRIVITILKKFTKVSICNFDWTKNDLSKVIKFIKEV